MLNPDIVEIVRRELGELLEVDAGDIGLEDNLNADLGVTSMQLAELVARLENDFGRDPFEKKPITSVRTVAQLCQAYEDDADGDDDPVDELLAMTRKRAQARRGQ